MGGRGIRWILVVMLGEQCVGAHEHEHACGKTDAASLAATRRLHEVLLGSGSPVRSPVLRALADRAVDMRRAPVDGGHVSVHVNDNSLLLAACTTFWECPKFGTSWPLVCFAGWIHGGGCPRVPTVI